MLIALALSAFLTGASVEAQLRAVAALPGEPRTIAAAGLTKADDPILSIENTGAFDVSSRARRVAILGGFDGDEESAAAVVDVVRWFKTRAPASLRRGWRLSAVPAAAFDAADAASLERWVTFQAPDIVVEVRGDGRSAGLTSIRSEVVTPADAIARVSKLMADAPPGWSALHETIAKRAARSPMEIARLLARRYPETPGISYIPALSWISTLRLGRATGDGSLEQKVREQTAPWASRSQPLFGNRIQLTAVAGTMVFAELGEETRPLALEGARLAAARKATGIAEYGQGWTDDMFMASAILARVGSLPDHRDALDAMTQLLIDYAARLQRPDGVFIHATDGPFAWGRGNGFAAFGLTEALAVLPDGHPARAQLLGIYRRQMAAVRRHQSPDGAWRQVIDEPGAYREESATAMLMTAMARGIRRGWLDRSYLSTVDRAWQALAAHVKDDGTIVDICTGTGAGPTRRYYLDRQAVTGADDRGGAMALVAAMEIQELRRLSSRRFAASSSAGRNVR